MGFLYSIIVGALCGWLAGKLMKGGGFGFIINIILGIFGGILGNWIFRKLGIHINSGFVNDIITGLSGSVVILLIASLFKK